jgi:hypothetical protein
LLLGLLGACQSPEPSTPGQAFPNQGSFPQPAFTGFAGTTSPSDFHHRPFPSNGWTWRAPTMMDFPCCVVILLGVPSPLDNRWSDRHDHLPAPRHSGRRAPEPVSHSARVRRELTSAAEATRQRSKANPNRQWEQSDQPRDNKNSRHEKPGPGRHRVADLRLVAPGHRVDGIQSAPQPRETRQVHG